MVVVVVVVVVRRGVWMWVWIGIGELYEYVICGFRGDVCLGRGEGFDSREGGDGWMGLMIFVVLLRKGGV